MKRLLKGLVLKLLKMLAKRRLKNFKGKVVAVTGSVGKTSTKEAVFAVLNTKYKVRHSKKSLNTEFGLLLSILDIESGFSSIRKWSWLITKALMNSLFRDHSEIYLLEFGVDSPGDMDALTSVIKPDVVIMTNVYPAHLAEGQFKDLEDIFVEKRKLVDSLKEGGVAILNTDNTYTARLISGRKKSSVLTFGKEATANFRFSGIKNSIDGVSYQLFYDSKRYEVFAPALGEYQAYVLSPAIACGVLLEVSIENCIAALEKYTLPPGRMSIIPAINDAIMIDSSYNSSPAALKEALKILKEIDSKRKVAVIGNMNELGEESAVLHKMIGGAVPDFADILIAVGDQAKLLAEAAKEKGMKERFVHIFPSATSAAKFFVDEIKAGDLVLVKGSQNGVFLERFVKMLMKNPEDAKKLLARQEKVWGEKL